MSFKTTIRRADGKPMPLLIEGADGKLREAAPVNIKPVHGKNRYCGPAAVSAITGCTTDQAALLMREKHGRKAIRGAFDSEVFYALAHLGYGIGRGHLVMPNPKGTTLAAWLKDSRAKRGQGVYLVCAGHHYLVVQGRRYVCSKARGIVPQADAPHRRARIRAVWEIVRAVGGVSPKLAELEARQEAKRASQTAASRSNASYKAEIAKLCANYPTIEVETERMDDHVNIWVTDSELGGAGNDPYEGDHIAEDWKEALEMVQGYVEAHEKRSAQFAAAMHAKTGIGIPAEA